MASTSSVYPSLSLLTLLTALVFFLPSSLALHTDASVSPDGTAPASLSGSAPAIDPEPLVAFVHSIAPDVPATGESTEQVIDDTLNSAKSSRRASSQNGETPVWRQETASNGAMALGGAGLLGLLFVAKNALGLAGSRFLLAPLFSRIDKNDMLENSGREILYHLIQANPGISLTQLAARAGLGWGTTVYHLGRLEQAGFVASMRQGQMRHFFEKGKAPETQRSAIAMLKNQTAGDMARFLLAQPGATQSAIGQALGIKAPVVTKYVKRLAGEGLVSVTPEGRSKVISPTSELSAVILRLDAPSDTLGVAGPHLSSAQVATAA